MNKFSQLGTDIAKLWSKYGGAYVSGMRNTLLLALIATPITALLGLKLGLWALLSYILLGAVGIPVFSGFRGGFGVLLGVTGGYIVGFIFTVLTVGLAVKRFGRPMPVLILSMAAGILLCYAFGTAWFMVVYARGGNAVTLGGALSMCVLPYLIPDGIKIVLAAALVKRLWPVASKELIPA